VASGFGSGGKRETKAGSEHELSGLQHRQRMRSDQYDLQSGEHGRRLRHERKIRAFELNGSRRSVPMPSEHVLTDPIYGNLDVDAEGRVMISAAIATHWADAVVTQKPKPIPNTNCNGCNTVKGCAPLNADCGPINVAKGCGGKVRE
jgi:hypothetical protein